MTENNPNPTPEPVDVPPIEQQMPPDSSPGGKEAAPPTRKEEPGPDDRLMKALLARLGHYLHVPLTVTIDAHALYWVVNLAVQAVKVREDQFKREAKEGKMSAVEVAINISSFHQDVLALVVAAEKALETYKPPRAKKGGRR